MNRKSVGNIDFIPSDDIVNFDLLTHDFVAAYHGMV